MSQDELNNLARRVRKEGFIIEPVLNGGFILRIRGAGSGEAAFTTYADLMAFLGSANEPSFEVKWKHSHA